VFDDLPSDLDRLRTLRVWHALWLRRIDAKIARLERRKAEEEHGRRTRPRPPEWVVEVGIGAGKPPVQVHAGHCHMIGSRRRPVSRDEARRLLADGLGACTHCQPDTELHIIDLAGRDSNSRTKGLVTLTPGRLVRATRNRTPACPLPRRSPNRTRQR
jgi:hypothetical protein